jgi:hypothetical protein
MLNAVAMIHAGMIAKSKDRRQTITNRVKKRNASGRRNNH